MSHELGKTLGRYVRIRTTVEPGKTEFMKMMVDRRVGSGDVHDKHTEQPAAQADAVKPCKCHSALTQQFTNTALVTKCLPFTPASFPVLLNWLLCSEAGRLINAADFPPNSLLLNFPFQCHFFLKAQTYNWFKRFDSAVVYKISDDLSSYHCGYT